MMCSAMRSLIDPPGFMNSSLQSTVASLGPTSFCSLTSGVLPMAERTVVMNDHDQRL